MSDRIFVDCPPAGAEATACAPLSRRRFMQGVAAGAAAVAGVTVAGALPSGALFASGDGPAKE
ncbi:MAG: twin-arginine translocation signal domain-containing protein, partial [Caldilineaceae bacterium]